MNIKKKNVLCYGDSNTFGFNPKDGSRYDENTRWTAILQKNLGAEYNVINDGMPNRTGFVDNPAGILFSAQKHFPETLSKFDNVYALILAIGTNDFMLKYNITFDTVENRLNNLIKIAKEKTDSIIVIPPPIINENVLKGFFSTMFDKTSIAKSKEAGAIFKKVAANNNCSYFDINDFASPSDIDGLHYDEKSHKLIADKLTAFIENDYNKKI